MRSDVARYIRHCRVCISTKPEQKRPIGLMLSAPSSVSRPWELVSADLVGPLPRTGSGHSYILSVCDCFSKFVLLFPLRTATASGIGKVLEEQVILVFGAPKRIIVDNGVQFRSRVFKDLMQNYDIQIAYTANYHPQANPVERVHRVIKTMLTAYTADNQKRWDQYLAKVASAIRSARHEVTGLTPNFINFGREVLLSGQYQNPLDDEISFDRDPTNPTIRSEALSRVFKDVQQRLKEAYDKSKVTYNLRRRNEQFAVGQKVWRRNHVISNKAGDFTAKLAPKFIGPFSIVRTLSPWTYELTDDSGRNMGVWHAKDLKAHPPD